jgi:hypothetical protein
MIFIVYYRLDLLKAISSLYLYFPTTLVAVSLGYGHILLVGHRVS